TLFRYNATIISSSAATHVFVIVSNKSLTYETLTKALKYIGYQYSIRGAQAAIEGLNHIFIK
ncbi:hypothetical protein BSGG_5358, partial [Bacteroides sp. D2]|uniref:hypothetical protein n=1 Tax=Bacteroides sp. D2 TaxID=556259 RepID=UPI0002579D99